MTVSLFDTLQEYPQHLVCLGGNVRLKAFLSEWPAFDRMYDKDLSARLLKYWRQVQSHLL